MEKSDEKDAEKMAQLVNEILYAMPDDETRFHFIENLNVCLHCGAKTSYSPDGIGHIPCFCQRDE